MYRKLTAEEVAVIRSRYARGGVTQKDLAQEFGVCRSTIGYLLRGRTFADAGGPVTQSWRRLSAEEIELIHALRPMLTCAAIAEELGVSRSTISKRRKRF